MLDYPLSISPDGGLSISENQTFTQIRTLLDCLFYERVMLPDFGIDLPVFDPLDPGTVGVMTLRLQLALDYWVGGGISVEPIDTDFERGGLSFSIRHPSLLTPYLFRYQG